MLEKNKQTGDFPGGPAGRNPPANAVDKGLIPGLERFHMPQGNEDGVPQLLKPTYLEPVLYKRSLQNEKLSHHN